MGCSSSKIDWRADRRLEFARDVFETKASLGNPNMSTKNVVVVPRDRVLAWADGFPKFEDCRADEHVVAADLVGIPDVRVLFFSHRWQDAKNNQADSSDNIQYAVLKLYLNSPDGQKITHVWIDLSCINQDRGTKDQPNPEGLKEFFIKLDNIGTAICCSAEVLVVPRLHQMEGVPEGHYYSDLQEYTGRGWCVFESATARLMSCEIRLGLVCGLVGDARFVRMGGSGLAPGKELSLEELRRGLGTTGGHPLKKAALACLPKKGEPGGGAPPPEELRRAARANWEGAFDPGAALAALCGFLGEDLACGLDYRIRASGKAEKERQVKLKEGRRRGNAVVMQTEAATLTMSLNPVPRQFQHIKAPQAAKKTSALLSDDGFTAVLDKEVVTRLLVNGGAFVLTGFEEVRPRPEQELQALVLEKLDLDHEDGPKLDLTRAPFDPFNPGWKEGLLPCEVGPVLAAVPAAVLEKLGLAGALVASSGRRPLRLDLGGNLIGPHGARCLREAVAGGGLPPLSRLNLCNCGLGVAGALHLADLLRDPAAAAALEDLEDLELGSNEVGEEGARALAAALPRCPALRKLHLSYNRLGEGGARALAEALPQCPALEQLELNNNGLGEGAARALAEALPRCPALRELGLSSNGVGEEAKAAVRAAWAVPLPDGTTLREGGPDLGV